MALNFPDSPTLNQVYIDTTSGFSYEWDGVVWKSYSAATASNISILDDISGSFNGSTTTFGLTSSGYAVTPVNSQQLDISLGGVIQKPITDYSVNGSDIIFTTAPAAGLNFFGKLLGTALPLNTVADGSVSPPSLDGTKNFIVAGLTVTGIATAQDFNSLSDFNFKENISTVENALDKVLQLRGVKFNWKESGDLSYGIIAQELQNVIPELVHGNDPKTVNYNGIIGVLIEAIKELKERIDNLER